MTEREGEERVKPRGSCIADRQLHNMKTNGTGDDQEPGEEGPMLLWLQLPWIPVAQSGKVGNIEGIP